MGFEIRAGAEPVPGFALISRLGRGGYGEVWRAHAPGGFQVALKFVELGGDSGSVEQRALDLIKGIRHPNLLSTFGSWRIDEWLVIAMELGEKTLLDRFREARAQGLPGIPAPEILEHFQDAARGLDYLNEPRHQAAPGAAAHTPTAVQHRDIKPQNLILVGGCVKVADFGLARVLAHASTSHTGSMTPAYAAPEFFRRKVTSHSDQYSLAITYCYLRGGRLPFEGDLAALMAAHLEQAPDLSMLPPREAAAARRALAKRPEDRWPNCREFATAVSRAADEHPRPRAQSSRASPPPRTDPEPSPDPIADADDFSTAPSAEQTPKPNREGPAPTTIDSESDSSHSDWAEAPITEDELRLVVGPNADRFLRAWSASGKTRLGRLWNSFNIAGFLLPMIWLPFRRMLGATILVYLVFALGLASFAMASIALERFMGDENAFATPRSLLLKLFWLLPSVVVGVRGNRWYLACVNRVIRRGRRLAIERGLDATEYATWLRKRGGQSLISGVILGPLSLFFLWVVSMFVVLFTVDMTVGLGPPPR